MLRPLELPDEIEGGNYVRIRVRKKIDFHLANIDLELESNESVEPLVKELNKEVMTLNRFDEKSIGLELNINTRNGLDFYKSYDDNEDWVGGVDVHLEEFCNLIENLSPTSRRIWNECFVKEFDLGFQSGNTRKTFKTRIQEKTVKRCAELGASIMITVYPHVGFDFVEKKELKKKKRK